MPIIHKLVWCVMNMGYWDLEFSRTKDHDEWNRTHIQIGPFLLIVSMTKKRQHF